MPLKTPALNAKGAFKLLAPWVIPEGAIFKCLAVRDFFDFTESGDKVYEAVYEPKGLGREIYEADKLAGASIVTLASPDYPTILVPNTYIESFPDLSNIAYDIVVLSVSLGPIPSDVDLTFLKNQIQGVVSDVIGVESQVHEHVAPSTGIITDAEHQILENARLAAISLRTTDRAQKLELQAVNSALHEKIAILEAIVRQHNLIPS